MRTRCCVPSLSPPGRGEGRRGREHLAAPGLEDAAIRLGITIFAGTVAAVAAVAAVAVGFTGGVASRLGDVVGIGSGVVRVWDIAVPLGAEFDAEFQHGRAIAAGYPAGEEPYLELRDTRKLEPRG